MAKRLQLLQDQRAVLTQEQNELHALAQERELTEEEQGSWDAKLKQSTDFDADIAALAKMDQDMASRQQVVMTVPGTDPPERQTQLSNPKSAAEDDPKRGFRDDREFLLSVFRAGARGQLDDRLKPLATAGSDEGGTYSDSYGGFLVPQGFTPALLSLGIDEDPIGGRTTKIPMAVPSIKIPARVDKDHSSSVSGGLTVTRRAETQTQAASRQQFEQVALEASSLFGLSYQTEELINDSPISIVALLQAGFRDEFTVHMIDERINGTGVGEFMGIMESPCLVSVAKETGQDADSIVYNNVVNMRSRCWRYTDAVWLYNHDALPTLMHMTMTIGTAGVPMWQTSAREGEPDVLLGRPAIATEYCKTIGDKGDLILGNWTQYLEGTYEPLQSAESIHVRFINHERTFKFWMRNAGAPWWKSALTPKNSTNTLSPFVVLDARA